MLTPGLQFYPRLHSGGDALQCRVGISFLHSSLFSPSSCQIVFLSLVLGLDLLSHHLVLENGPDVFTGPYVSHLAGLFEGSWSRRQGRHPGQQPCDGWWLCCHLPECPLTEQPGSHTITIYAYMIPVNPLPRLVLRVQFCSLFVYFSERTEIPLDTLYILMLQSL